MKQILCLSIAAVFLFGAAVVHGQGSLINIDCSSVQAISFAIDIPDIAQWDTANAADVDAWALNGKTDDASCKPFFNQGTGYVEYAAFSVVNCADEPTVSSDGTKLRYTFVIDVAAAADPTVSPATLSNDHQYTVTCFYDREQYVQASFEPLHPSIEEGSGNGQLLIDFTLHFQSDDIELVGVIDLGTPIYGKVLVEDDAAFPHLDVHLKSVTASEDAANSVNSFTLITNGCEEQHGLINFDSLTCDADADERFDMNAFRFPGQIPGDLVYFHATVIVCLSSNAVSECKTECQAVCPPAKRKRRETVQEAIQTTYYVSAGPYRIADPNKETNVDKNKGEAFPIYAIAVVAVCGALAIAIASAVVVFVLHRRHQNARIAPAERRDAYVTA